MDITWMVGSGRKEIRRKVKMSRENREIRERARVEDGEGGDEEIMSDGWIILLLGVLSWPP